jgi:inorganic pyrophosphatase
VREVAELPEIIVERLRHYFETYKLVPGRESSVSVEGVYGHDHAAKVIQAAVDDYLDQFGE